VSKDKPRLLRLVADNTWRARPGHKILVLDRGAVRLDYPARWHFEATNDCAKLRDRPPPDDEFALGVSYHRWPRVNAPGLSVGELVRTSLEQDTRRFTSIGAITEEARLDFALAWGEGKFIDPRLNREACGRLCLARKDDIQALITFDFWLSDLSQGDAYWHDFLAGLQLGRWVEDPTRGPVLQ
jgi:hypothetical protein